MTTPPPANALRQHLPGPDLLADVSLPLDELAANPETQPRLDLRPYLAGIFVAR